MELTQSFEDYGDQSRADFLVRTAFRQNNDLTMPVFFKFSIEANQQDSISVLTVLDENGFVVKTVSYSNGQVMKPISSFDGTQSSWFVSSFAECWLEGVVGNIHDSLRNCLTPASFSTVLAGCSEIASCALTFNYCMAALTLGVGFFCIVK